MATRAIAALEDVGTLGIVHLKRFWSQALSARAGYPDTRDAAADRTLLFGWNVGLEETFGYLAKDAPSFQDFENWILEINGGSLDPARVSRLNAALTGTIDPGTSAAPGDPEAALTATDLAFWEEHGYVVLHDAITPVQCHAAAQAIYDVLGADPADPRTWYCNPRGHSIWVPLLRHPAFRAARESTRVHAAFAQLWGRTDLWASIDQGGFNPPERPGWSFPGPHLHWDTSIAQPSPLGLQGILYLTDTSADQGAFTCVPGFHHRLADWLEQLPAGADPRHHTVLDTLPACAIPGRAGDLIIWHHALPHGASPNRSARPRVAQYVTLAPSRFEVNPVWK